jgi:hypothetical protein
MILDYTFFKILVGVLATIGLYSVLYKENKFYRLFEHIFLGLAVGWAVVALWTVTLKETWWDRMVGQAPEVAGEPSQPGFWAYILLLPIGLLAYFVFSRKHNWISRIPIGIILGLWAGQQPQVWWNRYGAQISDAMKPILPTTWESWGVPTTTGLAPEEAAAVAAAVYPSQVVGNIVFVFTLLSVLSYFLFSFDIKNKVLANTTLMGRWLLMVGFGAIFGSTVMMRFTLLIDRMYFVFIEFLQTRIFVPLFGGGG